MGQVLGRVTGSGLDAPRGPDVSHRVRVLGAWLDEGRLIEVELPRHLRCAACDGGGCDACDRSGALTLRGRGEPAEVVEVRLPRRPAEGPAESRSVVIRIPELGGLPAAGEDLPRGHLLLGVVVAAEPDPSVRLVEGTSKVVLAAPPAAKALAPAPGGRSRLVLAVALLVLLWLALLTWLRLSGLA